jgi:uncharacterized membrane protein YidH (DUF202 family)
MVASVSAVSRTSPLSTVLAADRNILASERTYAAWVRTELRSKRAAGRLPSNFEVHTHNNMARGACTARRALPGPPLPYNVP